MWNLGIAQLLRRWGGCWRYRVWRGSKGCLQSSMWCSASCHLWRDRKVYWFLTFFIGIRFATWFSYFFDSSQQKRWWFALYYGNRYANVAFSFYILWGEGHIWRVDIVVVLGNWRWSYFICVGLWILHVFWRIVVVIAFVWGVTRRGFWGDVRSGFDWRNRCCIIYRMSLGGWVMGLWWFCSCFFGVRWWKWSWASCCLIVSFVRIMGRVCWYLIDWWDCWGVVVFLYVRLRGIDRWDMISRFWAIIRVHICGVCFFWSDVVVWRWLA